MELPRGAEAANARTRKMLDHADLIAHDLNRIEHDPTGMRASVLAAIDAVRANPLDRTTWWALAQLTHSARHRCAYGPGNAAGFEDWDRVHSAVNQGEWRRWQMVEIQDAGAPICDEHGPMAVLDPPVPNGDEWQCVAAPDCRAGYPWLDGTHLGRNVS